MNNERRKRIEAARLKLMMLSSDLDDVRSTIESAYDDEDEAFNNLPESLQQGEAGTKSQEAIDKLESIYSDLAQMVSDIEAMDEELQGAAA